MPRHSKAEKEEWSRKKSRITDLHNSNGDWYSLAKELCVPRQTAYRWIKQGNLPDGRGGNYQKKITDEHRTHMIAFIEDNPRTTLAELVVELKSVFNLSITKQTVSNHLNKLCYTLKSIRFEPERANTTENKELRKIYVEKLLSYQGNNRPIMYMDESNVNLHISRSDGRSVRGSRCSTVAAGSKGANVHMIGCISILGPVNFEIRRGAFNRECAMDFIKVTLRKGMFLHGGPVVLVIDNAPCHSRAEEILNEDEFSQCNILRLGPYSPMFNPIENIWSIVKAYVKRNLASNMDDILKVNPNLTIREQRLLSMEKNIQEGIALINLTNCSACIAKVQGKIQAALAMEDMEF